MKSRIFHVKQSLKQKNIETYLVCSAIALVNNYLLFKLVVFL